MHCECQAERSLDQTYLYRPFTLTPPSLLQSTKKGLRAAADQTETELVIQFKLRFALVNFPVLNSEPNHNSGAEIILK